MVKLIKISSLRDPESIAQVVALRPDYVAFNFCKTSVRYMGEVDESLLSRLPRLMRKIGIFQDETPLRIAAFAGRFSLTGVELCGAESSHICELLSAEGLEVIKSFSHENIDQIERYEGVCNKFVFHFVPLYYRGETPFFVDVQHMAEPIDNPLFCGVDSCDSLERDFGCKDIVQIERLIKQYRL